MPKLIFVGLKILYYHIFSRFFKTLGFICLLLSIIIVIFDFSEKLEDYIKTGAPTYDVFIYNLCLIPSFLSLLAPVVIFLAGITVTSAMARKNESITFFIVKQNYYSFFKPFFWAITLTAIISYVLNGWVLPHLVKRKIAFLDQYVHNKYINSSSNIHIQLNKSNSAYFQSFDNVTQTGFNFSIIRLYNGKIIKKVEAERASWNADKKKWELSVVNYKTWLGKKWVYEVYPAIDTTLKLDLKDFDRPIEDYSLLTNAELNSYYQKQLNKGASNLEEVEVERYKRISNALSIVIMGMLGVVISFKKTRNSTGNVVFLGILITFSYILFQQFTTIAVIKAGVPALVGVAGFNLIYIAILLGLFRYFRF